MELRKDLQEAPKQPAAGRYRGEVAYIYAFDLAYDMKRRPVEQLLGRPMGEYSVGPSKRMPRHLFFYSPQMVSLPPERRQGPAGPVEIHRRLKLFTVGAISIQVRVPFEVDRLEDLVGYHDLSFGAVGMAEEVKELAEAARRELEPYCVRPAAQLREGEAYTVFCIHGLPEAPGGVADRAEDWLARHRREVAGLLTQEEDAAHLSEQEAAESTGLHLSYYDSDLVVVDWDAALVVGEKDGLDDVLHIMELANVQLVELEAYDRILDSSVQASYGDVVRWRMSARRDVQRNLREIRVDLTRLNDELLNITKFFGDWHLARIYQYLAARFHMADWHGVIDEKLRTLGELYGLLQQDRTNLWMVVLEATIVLLFVIDVIVMLLVR